LSVPIIANENPCNSCDTMQKPKIMNENPCELVNGVQREMERARKEGMNRACMETGEFLEAMLFDRGGGSGERDPRLLERCREELDSTLQELCRQAKCYHNRESRDHREVITFIFDQSSLGRVLDYHTQE